MKWFVLLLILMSSGCAEIQRVNEETRIRDCMNVCFSAPKGGIGYSDTHERYQCGCVVH